MILNRIPNKIFSTLLLGVVISAPFTLRAEKQVQTTKSETYGESVKDVTIERGEIVYVNGNSVVIKMEDGTLKHFDNVPEGLVFIVNGKPVNIHNVKVGMKLEKETVKTTTPRLITTVETVSGKVWRVSPPSSVILTLENGENQEFKIPQGQKFIINGQETDAWGLKKGMVVSAQRVTEVPETLVAQEVKRTGQAPPRAPVPREDVPILVVTTKTFAPPTHIASSTPPRPEVPPTKLPTTATDLPLIGLLGGAISTLALLSVAIRLTLSRFNRL